MCEHLNPSRRTCSDPNSSVICDEYHLQFHPNQRNRLQYTPQSSSWCFRKNTVFIVIQPVSSCRSSSLLDKYNTLKPELMALCTPRYVSNNPAGKKIVGRCPAYIEFTWFLLPLPSSFWVGIAALVFCERILPVIDCCIRLPGLSR